MRVVLSIGHTPGSGGNPSAVAGDLIEVDLCRTYGEHLRAALSALGHEVGVLAGGSYRWRQEGSRAWADCYLDLHANIGASRYGLIGYDARSRAGAACAEVVASHLADAWQGTLDRCRPQPCTRNGPGDWTSNMLALIEHCYVGRALGLVIEPGFLDQTWHREMWTPEGLQRTGHAIAVGLDAWWRSRE